MKVYFKVYRWVAGDTRPGRRFENEDDAVTFYRGIAPERQPSIVRFTEEEFVPSPVGDAA